MIHHLPTCPVSQAQNQLDADDLRWCESHPGGTRLRPLSWPEAALIAAASRPIPRAERRRMRVHVTQIGPTQLFRMITLDGTVKHATTAIVIAADAAE